MIKEVGFIRVGSHLNTRSGKMSEMSMIDGLERLCRDFGGTMSTEEVESAKYRKCRIGGQDKLEIIIGNNDAEKYYVVETHSEVSKDRSVLFSGGSLIHKIPLNDRVCEYGGKKDCWKYLHCHGEDDVFIDLMKSANMVSATVSNIKRDGSSHESFVYAEIISR